ncbi:DUF1993 domain-containing protein [Solimonas marina]|uniref:DUF1993 domain-containing protein n=1 Tax=Solimonas marina TaxID=2714601 RepID=A0A970B935_9GAMM|nr:DUF1993 domain-containing protein [Solimonas marina]NKF22026.1 DUF1993 domain-containing protein [Solimonas marina]
MTLSMYDISVPVFVRMLGNLRSLLEKGATHAESHTFDDALLADSRLFVDMLPLARQVHIASDAAKGAAARLAGIEPPSFEDVERSLTELIARVDKTVAFLQTLKPEQFEGSETRPISLKLRSGTLEFVGQSFLLDFALPNFYFHITTTYNILRHNGVEIGKMDYLGRR